MRTLYLSVQKRIGSRRPRKTKGQACAERADQFEKHEFEKQINAKPAKWSLVAEMFNKGFTAPKTKLVDSDMDIVFATLPDAEHCDADRLQQRWDKISKEYRDLVGGV